LLHVVADLGNPRVVLGAGAANHGTRYIRNSASRMLLSSENCLTTCGALTWARMVDKRSSNLAEKVLARLSAEIRGGKLAPGDRLPTEQELTSTMGVSRTVVREAVAALRADGLVVTRRGSGAYVADNPTASPFRIAAAQL